MCLRRPAHGSAATRSRGPEACKALLGCLNIARPNRSRGLPDHPVRLQSTVEQVKAQACRLAGVAADQAELTLGTRDVARSEQHATVASLGLVLEPEELCTLTLKVDRLPEHLSASKPVRSLSTGSDQVRGVLSRPSSSCCVLKGAAAPAWVEHVMMHAPWVREPHCLSCLTTSWTCPHSVFKQAPCPGGLQQRRMCSSPEVAAGFVGAYLQLGMRGARGLRPGQPALCATWCKQHIEQRLPLIPLKAGR